VESPAAIAKSTDPSHSFGVTGWLRGIWNDKKMKKAFTIIELLVAMGLLAMLIAISGMVFSTAVKAYRTAGAATEIAAKLQVITQQLDNDFRGLRKEGEFLLVWSPWPELDKDNPILTPIDKNGDGIPDRYVSFDRMLIFADGNFQSYDAQPTTTAGVTEMVYSNLARVSYIFGRNEQNKQVTQESNPAKHILCRTQHLISDNANLPAFPDISGWNAAKATVFGNDNFRYEFQTMTMEDWFNLPLGGLPSVKEDMLTAILEMTFKPSTVTPGGPRIDLNNSDTLHQLFMQNIGQFRVQIWRSDLNRWYPEIDPDGNGNYSDSDYYVSSGKVETASLGGIWNIGNDTSHFTIYYPTVSSLPSLTIPFTSALKFTFTLYDSNGVFKDGKTFTHIVYLNN
jgi:prepilin-type N-terminal cleavage/methylation domain-containing protein